MIENSVRPGEGAGAGGQAGQWEGQECMGVLHFERAGWRRGAAAVRQTGASMESGGWRWHSGSREQEGEIR